MSDTFAFSFFFTPGGSFPSLLRHCAVVKELSLYSGLV